MIVLLLAACSGGGDGNTSRQIDLSTDALSFRANASDTAAPATQVITANFGERVANLSVIHTGSGIERTDVALSGNSAEITIVPVAPTSLGGGTFQSTIGVTAYFCADAACSRLDAGGSRTVAVSYVVAPIITEVAPNVGIAGTGAATIIRGVGFRGFTIQGVNFGNTAATALTIESDTQIRATYPALPAGSYPVSINMSSIAGELMSTATLLVVDPIAHTAQTLAWPAAVTAVRSLQYDAQRAALLVGTDAGGGTIFRYPYAGGAWGAPTSVAIANLQDATLAADGSRLLALSRTAVTPLEPTTFAADAAVAAPSLPDGSFLKNIAMTNTNQAIVTTGINASQATPLYVYTTRTGAIAQQNSALNNGTPGASADGALVTLMQGDSTLTSAPPVYALVAVDGSITSVNVALNQNAIAPVVDRDSTRIVLNGVNVYDNTFALWGKLPETTLALALRPDGKRAYTYDSAAGGLLVFDTSATKSGEAYVALGAVVPLTGSPGANVKMTISPDGNTLILAGANQLVVQPTPIDP